MITHTRFLLFVALIAFAASCPPALGDKLLSKNATYTITGGGYVYSGQIQPGVNEQARVDGIALAPLIEQTEAGDELIDGDRSFKSLIYTPWVWHQPGKNIFIETTLPGDSKVNRVHVQFPKSTDYRPESATLKTKDAAGNWQLHERIFVHRERDPVEQSLDFATFELEAHACRELRIEVGGSRRHVGITEIEVWGDGPTESDRHGLVRQTPHIETVRPHLSDVPEGSSNLARAATVKFKSSHELTAGRPQQLIDGKRPGGIKIVGPPNQHWEIDIELDLGDIYQIDAVQIWMPGGKGVETGHLHNVKLAISPSGDQLDWDSPTGLIVNPYWPFDNAPRPHVISPASLDVAARRIRVHAYLSGTGGVTSNVAIGEVEVWGSKYTGPPPNPPRLELRSIEIKPQPIAKLSPKWQALRDRRIRGIWIGGDLDQPFGDTGKTKGEALAYAGFNTVAIYTGVDLNNRETAPELEDRVTRNVAEAHRLGITLLSKWQFGSTHSDPYRRFVQANGREHDSSCCPVQPDYIERHVGRWAVRSAELGADGFSFDTEMYESDSTHYPSACYCDSCFKDYLQHFSSDWEKHYRRVKADRRGRWVDANEASTHYGRHQRTRLIAQFADIRRRCRDVNSDFLFAYAPFLGYMSGLTHGLGSPEKPVIVWSEREYTHGPESRTVNYLKRLRDDQLPALYVCGHMIWYQDPAMLTSNTLEGALHTDGWWAWYGGALLNNIGTDDPIAFKSPYGRAEGYSAEQYLDAIKAMHARLMHCSNNHAINGRPRSSSMNNELKLTGFCSKTVKKSADYADL